MTDVSEAESSVLDLLSGDDYTIWEVEWWLNDQYPIGRDATNRQLARLSLRRLANLRFIEAFWCDGLRRRIESMTLADFFVELENDSNWEPEKKSPPWVGCACTELGLREAASMKCV